MKLCPHCSGSLEDDAVKCHRCGHWVVERARGKSRKKKRGLGKRVVVLGGLVLLAWAVCALPDGTTVSREILTLKPGPGEALEAVRSDLEALVRAESGYFQAIGSFSASLTALGFTPAEGVKLSLIATPTGWSATATHDDHPPSLGCAVYGGTGRPPQSPVVPSEPVTVFCSGDADG